MSDYPADLHEWVTFDDEDGDTWQFDLTFLTSNYGCIYGKGCPGVFTELAPEYEHGCCTYGAHFVDKEDRQSIRAQIDRLEPDLMNSKRILEHIADLHVVDRVFAVGEYGDLALFGPEATDESDVDLR